MAEYTLGFIFSSDLSEVLLLTRNEHAFHAHKTNGVGGKIEFGETPLAGIVRETVEETGLELPENSWKYVGVMKSRDWRVWVFTAKVKEHKNNFPPIKEGIISWHKINTMPASIVSNLAWLVPLSADILANKAVQSVAIWYNDEEENK